MCFPRPVSAASRLSDDILYYIFGFVMIDDGDKGPTTISHVCRRWRIAALEAPILWTNITMRMYDLSQVHNLALSRFERSGTRPLDITIHCTRNICDQERKKLIFPHADRIRRLVVYSTGGLLAEDIWAQLNVHMPLLESFDTHILPDSRFYAVRQVTSPEDPTYLIPFSLPTIAFDWWHWIPVGLTSLTLESRSFSTHIPMFPLYTILSDNAATLQHFAYEGLTPLLGEGYFCPPIQYRQLRSLYLSYFDDVLPLLELFQSANLHSLTLRNYITCPSRSTSRDDGDQGLPELLFATSPDQLLEALARWSGSLRELEIYGIDDLPEEQSVRYLRTLVHLERLYLYGRGGAERLAQILFYQGSSEAQNAESQDSEALDFESQYSEARESQDAEVRESQDVEAWDAMAAPLLPKLTSLLSTGRSHADLQHYFDIRERQNLPPLEKLVLDINFFTEMPCSLDFPKDAAVVFKAVDDPAHFRGGPLEERPMIVDCDCALHDVLMD
ncbi:hypothetical protein M413DRAFT_378061 [Hebeloma cylindrosporum]|uniref:Uncharacterized protein n=1 Tax=Hebeloma cylindrosporum TaxID=76867 RepID=A0A0C3C5W6_HEBCY|nr:hypothetical protein M413DRAFT_378061 [Hebeloma cylindrosporum h7]